MEECFYKTFSNYGLLTISLFWVTMNVFFFEGTDCVASKYGKANVVFLKHWLCLVRGMCYRVNNSLIKHTVWPQFSF